MRNFPDCFGEARLNQGFYWIAPENREHWKLWSSLKSSLFHPFYKPSKAEIQAWNNLSLDARCDIYASLSFNGKEKLRIVLKLEKEEKLTLFENNFRLLTHAAKGNLFESMTGKQRLSWIEWRVLKREKVQVPVEVEQELDDFIAFEDEATFILGALAILWSSLSVEVRGYALKNIWAKHIANSDKISNTTKQKCIKEASESVNFSHLKLWDMFTFEEKAACFSESGNKVVIKLYIEEHGLPEKLPGTLRTGDLWDKLIIH